MSIRNEWPADNTIDIFLGAALFEQDIVGRYRHRNRQASRVLSIPAREWFFFPAHAIASRKAVRNLGRDRCLALHTLDPSHPAKREGGSIPPTRSSPPWMRTAHPLLNCRGTMLRASLKMRSHFMLDLHPILHLASILF
ncbi:MAG: hypothetical protein C4519_05455 [Desulfobacteraceae bacterium]|nr:MAG: hypothetical protein C4519_05455 [Desulfobacteraceae bacterium]